MHGTVMPFIVWRCSLFLGLLGRIRPNEVAGMMVTASHNPAKDNGLKILLNGSFIIGKEFELALEKFVHEDCLQKAFLDLTQSIFLQNYSQKSSKVGQLS